MNSNSIYPQPRRKCSTSAHNTHMLLLCYHVFANHCANTWIHIPVQDEKLLWLLERLKYQPQQPNQQRGQLHLKHFKLLSIILIYYIIELKLLQNHHLQAQILDWQTYNQRQEMLLGVISFFWSSDICMFYGWIACYLLCFQCCTDAILNLDPFYTDYTDYKLINNK